MVYLVGLGFIIILWIRVTNNLLCMALYQGLVCIKRRYYVSHSDQLAQSDHLATILSYSAQRWWCQWRGGAKLPSGGGDRRKSRGRVSEKWCGSSWTVSTWKSNIRINSWYLTRVTSEIRYSQLMENLNLGRGRVKACSIGGSIPPRNVLHLLLVTSDTLHYIKQFSEGGFWDGVKRVGGGL